MIETTYLVITSKNDKTVHTLSYPVGEKHTAREMINSFKEHISAGGQLIDKVELVLAYRQRLEVYPASEAGEGAAD